MSLMRLGRHLQRERARHVKLPPLGRGGEGLVLLLFVLSVHSLTCGDGYHLVHVID